MHARDNLQHAGVARTCIMLIRCVFVANNYTNDWQSEAAALYSDLSNSWQMWFLQTTMTAIGIIDLRR
jgi:hypothetical protein